MVQMHMAKLPPFNISLPFLQFLFVFECTELVLTESLVMAFLAAKETGSIGGNTGGLKRSVFKINEFQDCSVS